MIQTFADKHTAAIFDGLEVRKLPKTIQATARRKLKLIDAAATLDSLRVPPGNRLEALKGNRAGQWSIRINDQWRICFGWQDGHAFKSGLWIITKELGMTITRDQLRTMNVSGVATGKRLAPIHPGDVLLHDFIEPMGLTRYKIAKLTNVQQRRIDEICMGKRAITADTALRLAKLFGMDAQTWMNLQAQYDLETAELTVGKQIELEVATLQLAA